MITPVSCCTNWYFNIALTIEIALANIHERGCHGISRFIVGFVGYRAFTGIVALLVPFKARNVPVPVAARRTINVYEGNTVINGPMLARIVFLLPVGEQIACLIDILRVVVLSLLAAIFKALDQAAKLRFVGTEQRCSC